MLTTHISDFEQIDKTRWLPVAAIFQTLTFRKSLTLSRRTTDSDSQWNTWGLTEMSTELYKLILNSSTMTHCLSVSDDGRIRQKLKETTQKMNLFKS